jgi:uncharacterized short protein YbdD (DUF466 family)
MCLVLMRNLVLNVRLRTLAACVCFKGVSMFEDLDLAKVGRYLGQAARLMVGVPDYSVYTEHMRVNHPDKHCMTYEEFFRERQEARYSGKGAGKCC